MKRFTVLLVFLCLAVLTACDTGGKSSDVNDQPDKVITTEKNMEKK